VHIILFTGNPKLSVFQPLRLMYIDPIQYISASGDQGGNLTVSQETFKQLNIQCPGQGDVSAIARSFENNVSYRLGGKGQAPPYTADTKDCGGQPCKDFCPEGTVCLDCSGFVATVAQCAGLASRNESSGTAGIFASAPAIESCKGEQITTANGTVTLTPGDLLGFKPGDYAKSPSFGHVWMYIGNGEVINSTGSGRGKGSAVKIQKLSWACDNFPLKFVDR
ncbi:MAG: NlpC/P60 family protein, partial [bacterium]|nr:NlpC/P60 family protein [bacterium]